MATTFDAILRIGARVQGVGDVRALSAAMRQVADETKQVAALERAQANLARVLLDNQKAAAATERERAAFATQRLQLSLRVAETEYTATIKQLAAQKELQAAQVKAAADRVRDADAAIKRALVVTNAMRSEKAAAQENLQIQVQKARAQYGSIGNLKQIAILEKQAAAAAAEGALQASKFSSSLMGAGAAVGGIRAITGAISTLSIALGAGVGVAGLTMAAKGIIDMGDSLDELAQRTGSSVDTLSQLGMAAQMSGSSIEEVSKGTVKLARNMGEIAAGGGEAAKAALDALGVSAFDAAGKLRIPSDVMLDIADGLQRVEDPALRVKLAMDLLGKGGASLVPALSQGSEAIQKLNTGISSDFAKRAGQYNDQLDFLRGTTVRLGASVLEALLPALVRGAVYTRVLIESASGWVTANKSAIVSMVSGITGAIKTLLPVAGALATLATVQWAGSLIKLAAGFNMLRTATQLATLAQAAYMSLTPVGAGIMLGSIILSAAAYRKLKDEMDGLDKKAKEADISNQGLASALKKAGLEADDILSSLNGQVAVTGSAKDIADQLTNAKERQAAIEKDILETQQKAIAAVEAQYQQAEGINSLAAARAEGMRDMAQQTLSVEQAQIDVARAILDGKMSMATTDEQRLDITRQIAELDRQAAEANYAAVMAQIAAEQQLETLRVINAENNFIRAKEAYNIAVRLGTLTADIVGKVETARNELKRSAIQNVQFDQSINSRKQVANLQQQAAIIRADNAAQNLPAVPAGTYTINGKTYKYDSYVPAYAKGGHVKGPTLALIGEGGEGESVVPDSKRFGFAMNVLKGMTGSAAIPQFAEGGYITGENPRNRGWQSNIGRSSFTPKTEIRNGMTYIFDPFGTIRLQQAITKASKAKGGLNEVEKNNIIRDMGGSVSPWTGFSMPAPADPWFTNDLPKASGFARGVGGGGLMTPSKLEVQMKGQQVAPDMFLVNGSEIRRMALEVAQEAIKRANAQQRQPSARRRQGVR